jgi:hypothetical protein
VYGIEVDRKDACGPGAPILDVVPSVGWAPERLAGTKNVATSRDFLNQLAVEHHKDDRAWMLVLPGFGTGIPAILCGWCSL